MKFKVKSVIESDPVQYSVKARTVRSLKGQSSRVYVMVIARAGGYSGCYVYLCDGPDTEAEIQANGKFKDAQRWADERLFAKLRHVEERGIKARELVDRINRFHAEH